MSKFEIDMISIYLYRIAHKLYNNRIPLIPFVIKIFIYIIFNAYIPYEIEIGQGTKLGYGGMGIVLHPNSKIGKNVIIGQQVTIGGRSKIKSLPIIGDNVLIGTGAKILGDVTIGNNVVIGANAVVIKSIPDNCVAAGIPAKIIKKDIRIDDYI